MENEKFKINYIENEWAAHVHGFENRKSFTSQIRWA